MQASREAKALKILIVTERFSPSVGGVETVTRLLGIALSHAGHSVSIVTNQNGAEESNGEVILARRPGALRLLRASDSPLSSSSR